MAPKTLNEDLKKERDNLSFDPIILTYVLNGGIQKTNRRRYIENLAILDKDYNGPEPLFLSQEENFMNGVRKEALFIQKTKDLNLSLDDLKIYQMTVFPYADTGIALHRLAFVPVMITQTTEEQREEWLPEIWAGRMLGCYAQTELGHGSHVRGLETTSTYDANTEQFVINSPSLTATKWWPGNMGKTANYALVLAQLYTQQKHCGMIPFLVQIRDKSTHQPLPGITVGDIGPTYGGDSNDNGFLRFDNVRIPRKNMLMRHAQVLPDGTFKKPQNDKLTYSGMLAIRAALPFSSAYSLAKAVTIATRYSCVRRQSELRPGAREPQIMDYVSQQHKLFPLIATAYAMWITATQLNELHDAVIGEVMQANYARLAELHGSAAMLKAYTTSHSVNGIEQCRLACGGHGYSHASGLPKLWMACAGTVTAEGEATVLLLQGARYLMKLVANAQQGKQLDQSSSYLAVENFGTFRYEGDEDLDALLNAFQYRTALCVRRAASRMQSLMAGGMAMHDAWNNAGVLLIKAAEAHAEYLLVQSFVQRVKEETDSHIKQVLQLLCAVFAIYRIMEKAGDFIQGDFMNGNHLDFLSEKLMHLYSKMRPEVIAYVDAFDFRDEHLQSILGRYDGNVYEELYKWAEKSPLNKTQVDPSFGKYLKPLQDSVTSKL